MSISYVTAAFHTSTENEAYIFMKNEYILSKFVPGSREDKILVGPKLIRDGFASLRGTVFAEKGIDCAFRSHEEEEAFIFCGRFCARINYVKDDMIDGPTTVAKMFPFLSGTVFESGIDAAFESSIEFEAYLFKTDQYARIRYGGLVGLHGGINPISRYWLCLRGTIFGSGIEAAFGEHVYNEAHLFKGGSYVCMEFDPGTTNDRLLGQVSPIKDYWPSLGSILPRKDYGGVHIHTNKSNNKGYINAAFRSSHRRDQVYIFLKNYDYVLLNYVGGQLLYEPLPVPIGRGFASLKDTVFGDHGIDCAFGCPHDTTNDYEAFIFSGNICAKITYAPNSANGSSSSRAIIDQGGPMTIGEMFPFLKGTVFESGVDAAFESSVEYEAYLFKGVQCALINYGPDPYFIYIRPTSQMFRCLKGTVFECGLDAAFASHRKGEAYLFKGDSCVCFHFVPGTSNDRLVGEVCKIKDSWSALGRILPH